jgi:hypothetical protein
VRRLSPSRDVPYGGSVEDVGRWAVLVCWDTVAGNKHFVFSAEGGRQRELLERFFTGDLDVFHLAHDDLSGGVL